MISIPPVIDGIYDSEEIQFYLEEIDSPATLNPIDPLDQEKLLTPALTREHLPTVACLLGYAMHAARSKGVWLQSFTIMNEKTNGSLHG
ncbi:hypothetical protein Tco_0309016 [Tanacetum coccineum]